MAKFTDEDDALLGELGVEVETGQHGSRSPKEERIIAGFEDIQRLVTEKGRAPQHGEERDIFERLYAVRLDRLRELPECRALLEPLDHQGLLSVAGMPSAPVDYLDDDALLAELGVDGKGEGDVTNLRFVRSGAEKRAAEEIANREKCEDFERFAPLFDAVQHDLDIGARATRPFVKDAGFLKADITQGQVFIVGGQVASVEGVCPPGHGIGGRYLAPSGQLMCLGCQLTKFRDVDPNTTQANSGQAAFEEFAADDPPHMGGGRSQASVSVPLVRAGPQGRHQGCRRDWLAAVQSKEAKQVGDLAGAPFTAVDS